MPRSVHASRSRRRMRVTVAPTCLISLSALPALADPAPDTGPPPGISDVDGRVFGAADGYASEQGEVDATGTAVGGVSTMAVQRYTKGTSWAATNHYLLVGYTGESQAYGNVYSSTQRVISASFKYTRDGKDVIGWQTSRAKQSGCSDGMIP